MDNYLKMLYLAAQPLRTTPFMRFGLPLLSVLVILALGYFGLKGMIKRKTIWLLRPTGQMRTVMSAQQITGGMGEVNGIEAVIIGIIYIIMTIFLFCILVPLSYYLLVG
ncbi:MAG: hypothetical protein WCW27_04575 [Patescibacteria group bacterium]|jgi:hypothetical protein